MVVLWKLVKRLKVTMAKNAPKGRKQKTGRSPYRKYNKAPFQYSAAYYAWHRQARAGRQQKQDWKGKPIQQDYKMAAE